MLPSPLPHPQLLQLHPGLSPSVRLNDLLSKLMSELWHQMTPEQHTPFVNMALRDKARYDRECEVRQGEGGAGGGRRDVQGGGGRGTRWRLSSASPAAGQGLAWL